jgi:hypothetical protein
MSKYDISKEVFRPENRDLIRSESPRLADALDCADAELARVRSTAGGRDAADAVESALAARRAEFRARAKRIISAINDIRKGK